MKKLNKKGALQLGDIVNVIFTLGISMFFLAAFVLAMGKFQNTTGITTDANTTIGYGITALQPIAQDWAPLWVTMAAISIVLTLIGGFMFFTKN